MTLWGVLLTSKIGRGAPCAVDGQDIRQGSLLYWFCVVDNSRVGSLIY
jgi:hypothetical protein